ncbi:MAG: hypothetical protein ABIG84_07185, partial [archaeon]
FDGTQSTDNTTQNATIEIKYILSLTVTPNAISTWYTPPVIPADNYNSLPAKNDIDPGIDGAQASGAVTVSLSVSSSDATSGIWLMATNMTSIIPSTYRIPSYNISRCSGNLTDYPNPNSANACLTDPANELQEYYTQLDTILYSGQSKQFVLFLDIPRGTSSNVGGYNGTVWIKVNATA